MNKKQIKAIKDSRDLWEWLKENPDRQKTLYPLYDKVIKNAYSQCPCCHIFTKTTIYGGIISCTICPLNINENKDYTGEDGGEYCIKEFYLWNEAGIFNKKNLKLRKESATKIYNILNEAYENIQKELIK